MKRLEMRLSGSGGQGLILAGIILAEAAILDKKNAVQSQSYGPEARGGSSKSEVLISEEAIHYPKVVKPDLLLAMTQEALDKYAHDLPNEAMLVIDTTFVKDIPNKFTNVHKLPITEKAKEGLGRSLFANILAIGAIVGLTKAVSKESAIKAVLARVPKGTEAKNEQAFELGMSLVTSKR